jgi:glutathione S-transferase
MKLYYYPGACSLAVHVALIEAGRTAELVKVDLGAKKTESGADFLKINPKGYVPALELDDGSVLTEAGVCCQYVADLAPQTGLAPAAGTLPRYRLMEWLNFITAEVHKPLGSLFDPSLPQEGRDRALATLGKRLDYLTDALKGRQHLVGDQFTVADAYLFNVLNWTGMLKVDLSKWPVIQGYMGTVAARASVQQALKEEGLVK